jgi:hypothetical protein
MPRQGHTLFGTDSCKAPCDGTRIDRTPGRHPQGPLPPLTQPADHRRPLARQPLDGALLWLLRNGEDRIFLLLGWR